MEPLNCYKIINSSLVAGTEIRNIKYLQQEIEHFIKAIENLKGYIPPKPISENLEILKCYLFGLIAIFKNIE